MVQGCNINILDTMKAPTMKAVKVATEEQKRLAQLSHIERIDQVEDSLITRMVEITGHTYEECAMELRGTDMDMESAINNLLEGNAEEWQTTKKKVRPEKPPKVIAPEVETPVIVKTRDSTQGRSSSRGRGRGSSTIDRSNDKDKSTDRSVEEKNRRNRERTNYSARGAAGRGRAGKRQLPPRMDRQRYSRDGSREGSDSTHRRGGGYNRGGRSNHYRDRAADNGDHKEPNWEDNSTEDNWASKTDGWVTSDNADSPGWGAPNEDGTEDSKEPDSEQWTDAVENQSEPPASRTNEVTVNGDSHTTDLHSAHRLLHDSTSLPTEAPAVETTRKRPAYTQAFTKSFSSAPTSLASLITSTNDSFTAGAPTSTVFSDPKTSAFSEPFAFSQAQSTVDSLSSCLDSVPDYTSRHEQATLKSEDRQSDLKLLQDALNNNSSIPAGRKISVEQLFQTQIGQMHDKPIASVPESLEERLSPASPPTSSTSSNNSARRSKRPQRSIPTEPVEMPGHTMESLDVQFGSIGFMDNTEEEEVLECPEVEKTPCVSKTDAATSTTPGAATTPHSVASAPSAVYTASPFSAPQETLTEIPGIHQVGPLRDTQSPQPSAANHSAASQPSAAVAPPNLPPPNIDNIRSANNLITQLPNSEEEERSKTMLEQQRSHTSYSSNTSSPYQPQQQQQQQQQQSKRETKSLPPGVSMYPSPQAQAVPSPQQSQPLMRPPYNYTSQGSFDTSAGVYEQPQHTQHHKYYNHLSNYESQQSHQMHGHLQTQHSTREPSTYSQSEHKQYSRSNTDHHTATSTYPAAHIGAGLTSGITHTGNNVAHSAHSAAGIGGTAGVAGYPPAVAMGHYYSFPPAPYHNMYAGAPNTLHNAYYPHFSPAHAQPIGFAQQQAKQSSSVGGYPANANSHYGEATSNHSATHQYHTSAQYDDSYKDMYSQSSTKQLPVTTSSDYSKMGMPEKNMFNVGFMHYPANNFFPQLQQTQQAQQALLQRGLAADQSSARSSQQPGAALNPSAKHYNWTHR